MSTKRTSPTRMHGVGAFLGMIWSAATRPTPRRLEVNRQTETTNREGTILRRTTIEEIELPPKRNQR
ncbi:MAG: hypothetical protein MK075_02480 [Phycisphaerales bacterium]|nr:hypothetical protein [Phycisphaerales bacterium]MEC8065772.1 hypothetical protein [Planctomycetota bacterium]MEC8251133.1 hypothetical protein [Planctomycetota bacterium]MEC8853966.1 hypothetical protein [Planctomycetota bacterium]